MFGNLLSQKKDEQSGNAQVQQSAPVQSAQQVGSDQQFVQQQPSGQGMMVQSGQVYPQNGYVQGPAQMPPPMQEVPGVQGPPFINPNQNHSQAPGNLAGENIGQSDDSMMSSSPAQDAQVSPSSQDDMPQMSINGEGLNADKKQNLTALSRLDPRATNVLNQATEETKRIRQALIEPEQLLYGLLYDKEIFQLLEQFKVDVAAISKEIQEKAPMGGFSGQPTLSEPSKQILEQSFTIAKNRASSFISPEDMLVALFSQADASAYLDQKGIKKGNVEEKLSKSGNYSVAKQTMLEKFGIDLTEQAREGLLDPVTGRDKELERLIHIILRRTKNNPILIGEAGVGKTAVVEALAQKIANGDVPADLQNKKVIQLEIASLIAGASHRGEFEERLRNIIREVQASNNEKILFIDEIHTMIGAGDSDGALDASNIIKPYLARGTFQVIGTTTTAEFRKYFEKDKAFARRFQPISVEEPDAKVAVEMMNVIKPKYEKYHNVTFEPDAVEAAVVLSKKYVGERLLPDKAVDVLDEAAAEAKLQFGGGKRTDNAVKKSDIEKVISSWTGIPITKLTEDESQKLLQLEDLIHKRLIDQEEAVVAVSEAVRRGRIGLSNTNRPIASFIFLGPTGVGKTELAKTLAEILFGRDDAMIRLDMSEYMEKHEVAKLIGAPPGYVGYEEGGQLTEAVRAKPYSIVLLDEVEKAHPDVFNILLQLLEDGRLTDNKGNTISFKNTIVIGTSNIGSSLIQQKLSEGAENKTPEQEEKEYKDLKNSLQDELIKFFRPELVNRFDGVVVFKPLSRKDMKGVTKIAIDKTAKLLQEQGFELRITDTALNQLAEEGYDPVYGARPLRRLIQTAIENPVSILIIGKTFVSGDVIQVDYDTQKQEYTFVKGLKKQENDTTTPPASGENTVSKSTDGAMQQPPSQFVQNENTGVPQQAPIAQSPHQQYGEQPNSDTMNQPSQQINGIVQQADSATQTGYQQNGSYSPNSSNNNGVQMSPTGNQ